MNVRPRDLALLAVVAVVAVIAAFYVLLLSPEDKRATKLQHSIATARTQLTSAQSAYAAGRAAQQRLSAADGDYTAALRAIPSKTDVPALLRLLQHNADATHVSITTIGLGSSGSGSGTAPASSTAGATSAQSVPVTLSFSGSYQALNTLVRRLDGLVSIAHDHLRANGPLVSIGNLTLSPGTTSGGGLKGALSVTLTATMYQTAATTSVTGPTSEGS